MSELGNKSKTNKKKGKLGKGPKIALITVIAVVAVILVLITALYGVFHYYYSLMDVVELDNESVESFTGEIDETDAAEDLTADTIHEDSMDDYLDSQQKELEALLNSSEDTGNADESA